MDNQEIIVVDSQPVTKKEKFDTAGLVGMI